MSAFGVRFPGRGREEMRLVPCYHGRIITARDRPKQGASSTRNKEQGQKTSQQIKRGDCNHTVVHPMREARMNPATKAPSMDPIVFTAYTVPTTGTFQVCAAAADLDRQRDGNPHHDCRRNHDQRRLRRVSVSSKLLNRPE